MGTQCESRCLADHNKQQLASLEVAVSNAMEMLSPTCLQGVQRNRLEVSLFEVSLFV